MNPRPPIGQTLAGNSIRVVVPLMLIILSGCAGSMRSYDAELKGTLQHTERGDIDLALRALEENNASEEKDLLYFLEKGELTRLRSDYSSSRMALLKADEKIRVWEEEAKADPEKLIGVVGSAVVNDKVTRYDGQDYEKVMASTKLAMTHLALDDLNAARTEIKKTHEREAVIKEFRDKKYAKVEEEAKSKGHKTDFKELKGYPVETLNDPEVVGLKNGYQNAFSHYLAGFIYEALNEPSLAAPGYRQAIELKPGLPFLEDGLAGLEDRRAMKDGLSDVLFVVESGSIAGRESVTVPLPVPAPNGLVIAPMSFPVIRDGLVAAHPTSIGLGGAELPLTEVANMNAMARRCLRDDMPGIVLRSTLRAVVKGTMQNEVNKRAGLIGGLLVAAVNVATEQADERSWRSLPNRIFLARTRIKPGAHEVVLNVAGAPRTVRIEVKPGAQLVDLRILGDNLRLVQPNAPYVPPVAPASQPQKTASAGGVQ